MIQKHKCNYCNSLVIFLKNNLRSYRFYYIVISTYFMCTLYFVTEMLKDQRVIRNVKWYISSRNIKYTIIVIIIII